jgi:DNA-binding MarR family transcriptional regulator
MSSIFVSYDLAMAADPPDPETPDPVDRAIEQWRRERPDLEGLEAMALFARLGHLAALAGPAIDECLGRFGIKTGEFDVLASLRRSGEPFELTPTALGRQLLLSSGAMTNRLDRLEAAGLVARRPDPSDRRGVIVGLTAAGRELVDAAVEAHVANEVRLLAGLAERDRATLDRILRDLLDSLARAYLGSGGT